MIKSFWIVFPFVKNVYNANVRRQKGVFFFLRFKTFSTGYDQPFVQVCLQMYRMFGQKEKLEEKKTWQPMDSGARNASRIFPVSTLQMKMMGFECERKKRRKINKQKKNLLLNLVWDQVESIVYRPGSLFYHSRFEWRRKIQKKTKKKLNWKQSNGCTSQFEPTPTHGQRNQ